MILINISFLYEDYILIICITYEETLGIHFNITNAANAFISLTSTQYPVTSVATSAMIISNYPVTNTALTSYTTSEVVDSDQFLSDVSYWLRDYYAYSLVHNTYIGITILIINLEKDINLTCSSSGGSVSLLCEYNFRLLHIQELQMEQIQFRVGLPSTQQTLNCS